MTSLEDRPLTVEEQELVETFRQHYAPPPRGAAQRIAMRHALGARIHRPVGWAWPALAGATCAIALGLSFLLADGRDTRPPETAAVGPDELLVRDALDHDLGDDGDAFLVENYASDADDLLPEDYAAIADAFDLWSEP
jgi:hypothetical protein